MIFWEAVLGRRQRQTKAVQLDAYALSATRLPYDKRCVARTKTGRRCRGRICGGTEFCSFHDPSLTPEQRRRNAAKGGSSKRRLAHIPGGYLRPLTDRASIGRAMDRLYRELRIGAITPAMARVLFDILCRLDDQLDAADTEQTLFGPEQSAVGRTRAAKLRPRVLDLLTQAERAAWEKAAAGAPDSYFRVSHGERMAAAAARGVRSDLMPDAPARLPAAS